MIQLKKSQATAARRRIPFYFVDDTDGKTPETGLTFSGSDLKVCKNGGAEADFAGSMSEIGNGLYYYEATAGELDTVGFMVVRSAKAGVRTFPALVQVTELDVYDASAAGLSNLNASVGSRAAPGDAMTLTGAYDAAKSAAAPGAAMTLTGAYDAAKTAAQAAALATVDGNVDDVELALAALITTIDFLRKFWTNRKVWDDTDKHWHIYDDDEATVLYDWKPRTMAGSDVSMSATAFATMDEVSAHV
jgi:hypothetical protein